MNLPTLLLQALLDTKVHPCFRTTRLTTISIDLSSLVDHDPAAGLARLESCFHYEHVSLPRPRASSSREQHSQREKSKPREVHAGTGSGSGTTKALENFQSNAIEIPSDQEEEDDGDVVMLDNDRPQYKTKDSVTIDLTTASSDEELTDEDDHSNVKDTTEEGQGDPQSHSRSGPSSVGKRGPRVILRIDTSLLDSWKPDVGGLVDFIGEIMYDEGHWAMQARTFRSMEGVDLHAYRHSILLTRSLVQSTGADRVGKINKEEPAKKGAK